VYVAGVHLREVGDHADVRVTFARGEGLHSSGELVVREASEGSENVVLHARL